MMISGGNGSETSVEVISPSGGSCTLPPLPSPRTSHTLTLGGGSALACGGWGGAGRSCARLTGGGWSSSHGLQQPRAGHASWAVTSGVILLGGAASPRTSELAWHGDDASSPSFPLQYDTMSGDDNTVQVLL